MLHINRFIDKLNAANSRQQRDLTMTVADARALHSDITKLLLAIQELQESQDATDAKNSHEVTRIEFDGGKF